MTCPQLDMRRNWVWKGERKGKGFMTEETLLEVGLLIQ